MVAAFSGRGVLFSGISPATGCHVRILSGHSTWYQCEGIRTHADFYNETGGIGGDVGSLRGFFRLTEDDSHIFATPFSNEMKSDALLGPNHVMQYRVLDVLADRDAWVVSIDNGMNSHAARVLAGTVAWIAWPFASPRTRQTDGQVCNGVSAAPVGPLLSRCIRRIYGSMSFSTSADPL